MQATAIRGEIARKGGVHSTYVGRMVNVTALAPDVVVAIFDETYRRT